jgi:hypothetical protein
MVEFVLAIGSVLRLIQLFIVKNSRLRLENLRAILREKCDGLRHHFLLSGFVGLGRRRGPTGNRNAYRKEEFIQPGGRVDAKQPHWVLGRVDEGMGSVGRDVDGLARSHDFSFAPKGELDFALKDGERFLEIMAMRRWTAARRDVHVNQTITTVGVFARNQNGVGVPYDSNVEKAPIFVGVRNREMARSIVRRDW